jgi:hypothetical protein
MRIEASRLKYLAFVFGLGACFFDPKATGPSQVNPISGLDGSVPLLDGSSGTGGSSGQAGDIATGAGGMSVATAGAGSPASTSGTGGAGPGGGPPPPPLLVNGAACTDDARCASGHCDTVCCEKGSECCKDVADCTTQGGLGMSCDDRSMCRGSAGKITCTSESKCVTVNGARNDMACSNRVEANDCGLYPSVFCLGGELQQGAPPCATSCANDGECDIGAHCNMGKCEADKPNGQKCSRPEDCTAGFCKNIVNGEGVCCGLVGDCCATPDDCPASYRSPPMCTDAQTCKGTETRAMCIANICSPMSVPANSACDGMPGPNCGLYQDVTCMSGRSNQCRTSCTTGSQCDANAFCDGKSCVAKKGNGELCANTMECTTANCMNGVCCGTNQECCKTAADCTLTLDLRCNSQDSCQGTKRSVMCQQSRCAYGSDRVSDDSACKGSATCGAWRDRTCSGAPDQAECPTTCTEGGRDCDDNAQCVRVDGVPVCMVGGPAAGSGGPGPGGGASGGPSGNGNGNGNGG